MVNCSRDDEPPYHIDGGSCICRCWLCLMWRVTFHESSFLRCFSISLPPPPPPQLSTWKIARLCLLLCGIKRQSALKCVATANSISKLEFLFYISSFNRSLLCLSPQLPVQHDGQSRWIQSETSYNAKLSLSLSTFSIFLPNHPQHLPPYPIPLSILLRWYQSVPPKKLAFN